jgi:two-component SAPR family response regulator
MSSLKGPIIIIEDDKDDQEILADVLKELKVKNPIYFFSSCNEAFYFLMDTPEKPFLIISDVNLPEMNGIDFRKKILENDHLRKKTIPFIFLSTSSRNEAVIDAYELLVQGYFKKPNSMSDLKQIMESIISYWKVCVHPEV